MHNTKHAQSDFKYALQNEKIFLPVLLDKKDKKQAKNKSK